MPPNPPNVQNEVGGFLVSLLIVVAGNLVKPVSKDAGNLIQGFGIGTGVGTVAHYVDQTWMTSAPHHDLIGVLGLPVIYVADKTKLIEKDLANNLYGGALGLITQHLLTEGCSFCGNAYCPPGENLC